MKKRNPTDAQFPWTYFILAFGITWLIWSPGVLATLGLMELPVPFIVFFFAGTWGPFLAASWVIYRDEGREGVKRFWRRGLDFRIPGLWLLVIFGVPLLLAAVPVGVYVLAGGTPPELSLLSQPWMTVPIFLTYFLTGGGNEEWGWRGYALDRLQSRWSPLMASIVLGLIWGAWHVPLFFIQDTGQYHMSLIAFLLAAPALSVLHTWVYNGTGSNLLSAWLFHTALGTAWEVFPIVQPQLQGYQRVHIYDFAATVVVGALVVALVGSRLGAGKIEAEEGNHAVRA